LPNSGRCPHLPCAWHGHSLGRRKPFGCFYRRFQDPGCRLNITHMGRSRTTKRRAPSVFISWAHRDSSMTDAQATSWRDLVLALAEYLNALGCDVRLDLHQQGVDWSRWGPEMILKSDFTLIVPSKAYQQRWDGQNPPSEGAGAAREVNVLKGRFDKDQKSLLKQAAVIMLPGITKSDVPDEIYAYLQRFPVDPANGKGMEPLLRHLTKQPEFVLPKRGVVPKLPPKPNIILGKLIFEPRSDEMKTSMSGTTIWLPGMSAQCNDISHLAHGIEGLDSPPTYPSGEDRLDEQIAMLANWADDVSSLVNEIEQVRSHIPRDPSVRFTQVLDDSRAAIQEIIDGLGGPRTKAHVTKLTDRALALYRLVQQLARLSLEP